jgi:hypothetical protein
MLAGAANVLRVSAPAASTPGGPLFSEVPASASGIGWVHENAMSPSRFLPEALGPGCAFLDYDNDGWMDIFLVNSGPSDFYKPPKPLRNALYKNNRDGTFSDVTEKAGVSGAISSGSPAMSSVAELPCIGEQYPTCLTWHPDRMAS